MQIQPTEAPAATFWVMLRVYLLAVPILLGGALLNVCLVAGITAFWVVVYPGYWLVQAALRKVKRSTSPA